MRRIILAIAAACIASSGCAYYNTFYLAKKNYNDAHARELRSSSEKVPPEVATLYDKSIEMSAKVVTRHPRSRWADDAVYLIGLALFGKRDYDGALEKFEALPANYPKSNLVPDALFMSGVCFQKKRNFAHANTIFADVLRLYPKFDRRDEVLLIVARGAAEEKRVPEAIAAYRDLVRRYKGSSFRDEAYIELGDLYLAAEHPDSARMAYGEAVRAAGEGDTKARALLKLARALSREGRPDEAEKAGLSALSATKNAELLSEARLEIGATLQEARRLDEAIAVYQQVVDQHPRTAAAAQALFQIGFIHEAYRQDFAAAREAYDRVKGQGAKSAFVEQAVIRSKNLEKMQQFSQTLADSGDAAAAAAFKLAELNFFQLDKPDSALKLYAKVENEHAGSPYAPKAAFARAWILRDVVNDTAGALVEYQRVVDSYPRSEAAVKARELLGLPPVVFEPDTLAAADSTASDSLAWSGADSLAAGGVASDSTAAAADTLWADTTAALGDSAAADSTLARRSQRVYAPDTTAAASDTAGAAPLDSLGSRAPGKGGGEDRARPGSRGDARPPDGMLERLTPAQLDSIRRAAEEGQGARSRER